MIFYTDGAYSPLLNKGGWAFYNLDYNIKVTNQVNNTTNNRMELTAVLAALQFVLLLNLKGIKVEEPIIIYTDSRYVIGSTVGNWKRNINLDLLRIFDIFSANLKVKFKFVKGHSTSVENNLVDMLANITSQI